MVNPENHLLDCIREADWASALALMQSQNCTTKIATPGSSVFAWLITLDAPTELIIALLQYAAEHESIDLNKLGLFELCMHESSTKANAFDVFSSLLEMGLTPNLVVTDRGCTHAR